MKSDIPGAGEIVVPLRVGRIGSLGGTEEDVAPDWDEAAAIVTIQSTALEQRGSTRGNGHAGRRSGKEKQAVREEAGHARRSKEDTRGGCADQRRLRWRAGIR